MTRKWQTKVTVGIASEEDMSREFVEAWHQAERGAAEEGQERLYFLDVVTLLRVLSEQRLALLRALRHEGPTSIRALSKALGRDYKNVHADVQLLHGAGLIHKATSGRVSVPWDRIQAEIDLAA